MAEDNIQPNLTYPQHHQPKQEGAEPDFQIAVSGGNDSDSIFQEGVTSALD
jgi:hypothetical protein